MQNPAIKVVVSAQPGEKCKTDLKNVKSVKPDCILQKLRNTAAFGRWDWSVHHCCLNPMQRNYRGAQKQCH